MSLTIPKSILLTPKIPSIAVVGLLIAQLVVLNFLNSPEPTCSLIVERPHLSTSLKESKNINAIKLNVTSRCTAPQKYTRVTAEIQKLANNREVTVANFLSRTSNASIRIPREATFRNLFIECQLGKKVAYRGSANGYVVLESGKKIYVAGSSGKYEVENCGIGA